MPDCADPYMEKTSLKGQEYYLLVSTSIDSATGNNDAHNRASEIFATLSSAMRLSGQSSAVTLGAVFEFDDANSSPKVHHILNAEPGSFRLTMGRPSIKITDSSGVATVQPPQPSRVQIVMAAAARSPKLAEAIRHLSEDVGWIGLFKAHECLQTVVKFSTKKKIDRFSQTANRERHHDDPSVRPPHKNPMTFIEAEAFIQAWLQAAVDHIDAQGAN